MYLRTTRVILSLLFCIVSAPLSGFAQAGPAPPAICAGGPSDGAPCQSVADCAGFCDGGLSAGTQCLDSFACSGLCEVTESACSDELDCPQGECTGSLDACRGDSDCASVRLCQGGASSGLERGSDEDCGELLLGSCVEGACTGAAEGQSCLDDLVCVEFVPGVCAAGSSQCTILGYEACLEAGSCEKEAQCIQTVCSGGPSAGETCDVASDCAGVCRSGLGAGARVCSGPLDCYGECEIMPAPGETIPCLENSDCPASNFGICADTGDLCAPGVPTSCPKTCSAESSKAGTACTATSECATPQFCLGGQFGTGFCASTGQVCSGNSCPKVGVCGLQSNACVAIVPPLCVRGPVGCEQQTAQCDALPTPLCPVHRWQFDEPAGAAPQGTVVVDSLCGADGTIQGAGAELTGTAIRLPGGSSDEAGYVDLPNDLLSELTDATFEAWYEIEGVQAWARVFDFGASNGEEVPPGTGGAGTDYIFYSPLRNGSLTSQRTEMKSATTLRRADTTLPTSLGERYHVAVTFEADGEVSGVARVTTYRNGVEVSVLVMPEPLSSIPMLNNWLGRSNYTVDSNFQGTLVEFRLHDQALSAGAIASSFGAGPDVSIVSVPGRDRDADGIVDEADNCAAIPNTGQDNVNEGSDDDSSRPLVQHYGDACDADLDDDGIVAATDFFGVFRPCLNGLADPSCDAADLDGDGSVTQLDFIVLRPALGSTPGPGFSEP